MKSMQQTKRNQNEKSPNTKVTQILGIAVFANVLVTQMAKSMDLGQILVLPYFCSQLLPLCIVKLYKLGLPLDLTYWYLLFW